MRTALTSPTCVAFSSGGGFSSPNSVADFDFVSGNFASFPYGGGYVNLYAYDDENLVGGVTLEMFGFVKAEVNFLEGVATGVYSADFWGTFSSVDRVEFRHNYGPLAMDDLVVETFGTPVVDKIDVPNGWDIAELVASATSDGSGGTVLTHDEESVTLVGIDPSTVSADWFV